MPYATPSSPAATTTTSPMLTTHSLGRPGHRRSYSAQHSSTITPSSASASASPGGAFTSLRPPSRKQKFHLNASSSSSSESEDDDGPPPPLKLKTPLSPSFGGVPFPKSSPLNSPVPGERDGGLLSPLSGLQTHITNLPGSSPRHSPRTSPRSSSQSISITVNTANPSYLAVPKRPHPSRTASSPILLSNGKPLKSSLKGSSSTSNIPVQHPSHPNHQPHHSRPHHVHHAHQPTSHQRARSAPSTPWEGEDDDDDRSPSPSPSTAPSTPKNVHFPSLPNDLEHIRVFNKSAKPISFLRRSSDVSRGPTGVITNDIEFGADTETETETDREAATKWGAGSSKAGGTGGGWAMNGYLKGSVGFSWGGVGSGSGGGGGGGGQQGFPFPRVPSPPRTQSPPKNQQEEKKERGEELELDLKEGFEVPSPSSSFSLDRHVVLEKMQLEKATAAGEVKLNLTVLVKNVAYEKQVYFRFTMDDWATVSEVGGKYLESVSGAAVAALGSKTAVGKTLGDIISTASSLHSRSASEPALGLQESTYDRFLVTVSLTDYLHLNLENRVMWGVVRYTAPGRGEWWDNNGGKNYRVGWKKVVPAPTTTTTTTTPVAIPGRERKEGGSATYGGRSLSAPASTLSQPPPSISVVGTSPPATTSTTPSFTMPAYAPSSMMMSASPPTSSFMSSYSPPTSSFMSSYSPPQSTNTTVTYSPTMSKIAPPSSPPDTKQTEALSQATQNRLSRFSLKNYVAPGSVRARSGSASSTVSDKKENTSTDKKESTPKPETTTPTSKPMISIEVPTPEKKKPQPQVKEEEKKKEGLSLYWPWSSSSSSTSSTSSSSTTSTNSTPTPKASDTNTKENTNIDADSSSPVVTPGGSATVEILPSGSSSKRDYFGDAVVAPALGLSSRSSSMSSTDGVPSLDDASSTSTTSSSESLDRLMFGGSASAASPYQHHRARGWDGAHDDDDEFGGFDWHPHDHEGSGSETEKPQSHPGSVSLEDLSPSPSPSPSPVEVTLPKGGKGAGNEMLYKAFVEKWCFAESPRGSPPLPGVGLEVGS
ncbi:hypothetical protein PQX77_001789 [Marasmius sp. AFHP31]|nr:hypothetical protein PQX77_001789 [Marasmius sp. AFHP31]